MNFFLLLQGGGRDDKKPPQLMIAFLTPKAVEVRRILSVMDMTHSGVNKAAEDAARMLLHKEPAIDQRGGTPDTHKRAARRVAIFLMEEVGRRFTDRSNLYHRCAAMHSFFY